MPVPTIEADRLPWSVRPPLSPPAIRSSYPYRWWGEGGGWRNFQEQVVIPEIGLARIGEPRPGSEPDILGNGLFYVVKTGIDRGVVMVEDLANPESSAVAYWRELIYPHHPQAFKVVVEDENGELVSSRVLGVPAGPRHSRANGERVRVLAQHLLNQSWGFEWATYTQEGRMTSASIPGPFAVVPEDGGRAFRLALTLGDPSDRGDDGFTFVVVSDLLRLRNYVPPDQSDGEGIRGETVVRVTPPGFNGHPGLGGEGGRRRDDLWVADYSWQTRYREPVVARNQSTGDIFACYLRYDQGDGQAEVVCHEHAESGWEEGRTLPLDQVSRFSRLALSSTVGQKEESLAHLLAVWETGQQEVRFFRWSGGSQGEWVLDLGYPVNEVFLSSGGSGWDLAATTPYGVVSGALLTEGEVDCLGIYPYHYQGGRMAIATLGSAYDPLAGRFAVQDHIGLTYSGSLLARTGFIPLVSK